MRHIELFIALLLVITPLVSRAQIDHSPKWSNNFTALAYNLNDLDQFSTGAFGYCKWGNLQDKIDNLFETDLDFTSLTKKPYSNLNEDLFLASNSDVYLQKYNFAQNTIWNTDNSLTFNGVSYFRLYRYLHFINNLTDASNLPLTGNESKLIILFHGWNPSSNADAYTISTELTSLVNNLKDEVRGTDWKIVLYRWEPDSDTGSVSDSFFSADQLIQNATEAAEIGHQHGQHLGQLLSENYPNLQKVHAIAHSAGSWAARGAIRYLLEDVPYVTVQLTLLDPFMPNSTDATINSSLGKGIIDLLDNEPRPFFLGNLENYYAENFTTPGTQEVFNWSSSDTNYKVGESSLNTYYGGHSGPIQFFADTILYFRDPAYKSTSLAQFYLDLRPDPYIAKQIGWNNSLFLNEPVLSNQPLSQNVKSNTALTLSAPASSRKNNIHSGSATTSMTWLWFKDNEYIQSTTIPTLTIQSAKDTDSGLYQVLVSDAFYPANITISDYAQVTVLPAQTASLLETWRATNFPSSTAITGAGANNADADNDGLANLLEYALGTNATIANTTPVTVGVDVSGVLKISFPHIADASLVYNVKGTNDLSVGFGTTPVGSFTGFTTVGITNYLDAGFPLSSNTKRFLRLEVSAP